VYLLGHAERIKGANTTFLIFAWLAPLVAFVTAVAYVLGAKLWGFSPAAFASFLAGILISLLFWPSGWVSQFLPNPISIGFAWLVLLGGSFLSPFVIRAWNSRGSAPANS
jgi:hypothetical protein